MPHAGGPHSGQGHHGQHHGHPNMGGGYASGNGAGRGMSRDVGHLMNSNQHAALMGFGSVLLASNLPEQVSRLLIIMCTIYTQFHLFIMLLFLCCASDILTNSFFLISILKPISGNSILLWILLRLLFSWNYICRVFSFMDHFIRYLIPSSF